MFTRQLNRIIFQTGMISFCFTIFGCATGSRRAYVPPTITINTIPAGADISVQGNFIGTSPIAIPMPIANSAAGSFRGSEQYNDAVGKVDQPLLIQAQLAGYQTKDVALGEFHAGQSEIVQPIFSASAVNKTTPGYYKLPSMVTIKLAPLHSSDVQESAPATGIPVGVYQATRNYGNGDTYIGEFLQGQFHGKGMYTYANGDKYEGEFVNGKFTGKGSFTCSNGKQFVGNLENKVPLEFTIRCN